MSTNMTGGADGGIAIQVRLDTSKASKELNRLEQKILKLQEEVTVGKTKKSALVAQLEQANTELTALQAKTKIDGKNFVISPEDSKRISDLKIQIEQTQAAIEQQNKALSDTQLTLEGVKIRYGEVTQRAQALAAAEQETAGGSMQEAREHVEQTADAFAQAQRNAEELNDTMDGTQGSASRMEKAAMKVQKSMERIAKRIKSLFGQALFFGLISRALSSFRDWLGETIRQNDAATAALSRLKGALLTLAQPILGVVLPAFTALVDALTRIVTMVAEFISILTGTSFSASKDAAKNLNEEKKALDGVGAAAASAEKSMAGFDEINKLTANNASGGGGGASSGIAAEFDSLTSTLPKWLANLAKALHDFAEDIVIKIRELKFEWDKGNILKSKDAWLVMLSGILGAVIGAAFGGLTGGVIGLLLGVAIGIISVTWMDKLKNPGQAKNIAILVLSGIIGAVLGAMFGGLAGGFIGLLLGVIIGAQFGGLAGGVIGLILGVSISLARIAFSDEVSEASRKLAASGLKIILTSLIFALIGAACGFGPAGAIVGGVIGLVAGTLIQIQAINFDDSMSEKEKQKATGILKTVLYGIIGALIGAAIGGVFGGIVGGIVGISLGLAIHWSSITYDEVPKRTAGSGFSGGGGFGSRTSRAAYQSLQVPPVSSVDLPRLASGAVIPPNREFLAVLGDQRQGMNLEAPADMIRQMVADGIRAAGIGSGSRTQTVILQVGRRELGRVVYELNKEETQRVGVKLAGVKA
ncbi:hypothetical protein [Oscillospiraceae bacterium]|nr:hypothetical protein [Oscillospiraceae bacterium]